MKSQMMQHDADGDYDGADCDGGDAKHKTWPNKAILSMEIPSDNLKKGVFCQGPPLLPSVALKELKLTPLP